MTNQTLSPAFDTRLGFRSTNCLNLAVIVLVWTVMAILANPIGDFPLNDDWVYGLAVKSVVENGYYQFPSPSSANVGPQVYWGALFCLPFGFSFTALRFSSLVLGLIGIVFFYYLIKLLGRDARTALFGALVLAVNPLYFGLANSFMTDVPFLVVVIIALYFFVRGFERDSLRDLIIGIAISFVAILIRQLGIVLLLGVAVAYPVKYGIKVSNIAKVTLLVVSGVLLHISYQYWLIHTARTPRLMVHSDIRHLMSITGRAWYIKEVALGTISYVGFFVLPFVLLVLLPKFSGLRIGKLRNSSILPMALIVALVGLNWWKGAILPSLGNVMVQSGLGPLTLRDTYVFDANNPPIPQMASILWTIITVLSTTAGAAAIFLIGVRARQAVMGVANAGTRPLFWSVWLLMATGGAYFLILIFIAGSLPMFDRYLLVFVPIVILLLSGLKRERTPPARGAGFAAAMGLMVFYAYFSVAATHDYLQWNRVRWQALNELTKVQKIKPGRIDGGYEFNGILSYDSKYTKKENKSWWWVDDDEYVIASGPFPGYTEIGRYSFDRWLLFSESNILILHRN